MASVSAAAPPARLLSRSRTLRASPCVRAAMRAAPLSVAVLVSARFFVPVARAPDGIVSHPTREPARYSQTKPVHGIASHGPHHRTPVQGEPVQGAVTAWGASAVAVGVAGTVAVAAVLGRTARGGRGPLLASSPPRRQPRRPTICFRPASPRQGSGPVG